MYQSPKVNDLGSFAELTLSIIDKMTGGTDTVNYSDGTSITIPGHGATVS